MIYSFTIIDLDIDKTIVHHTKMNSNKDIQKKTSTESTATLLGEDRYTQKLRVNVFLMQGSLNTSCGYI